MRMQKQYLRFEGVENKDAPNIYIAGGILYKIVCSNYPKRIFSSLSSSLRNSSVYK